MVIFDEFNINGNFCPICRTKENKKTLLIPRVWTMKDKIIEATQVHLECIQLVMTKCDDDNIVIHHVNPFSLEQIEQKIGVGK